MKSNSHGQQRSQDQNKRLCSFGYPALRRIAEATETQILGRQLLGLERLSGRNTARRHEPNRTRISSARWKVAPGTGRKRILAGTARRVRILPGGKITRAEERNR